MKDRRLKILVLSSFDGADANVSRDSLFSFNGYSKHDYYYIFDCRILDRETDFSVFDTIVLFWSVDLLGPHISEEIRERIARAPATKVLFLQDEYRDVRAMNAVMRQLGSELVFTCVAEGDHETFYPLDLIPTLRATRTVLPGYVPAYLEHARMRLDEGRRSLDIGYRSRTMPFYLGDIGQDKRIIAERFQAICEAQGLRHDISVREEDRLYGPRWLDLLRASRCVLGSVSGASVVDFTGQIRRECERYLALKPTATYEEVKSRFFADVDWKVVIDTVSPRVFEAAALRCTMVQLEGRYAGILEPDRHYISVKRDYSNVADVVERIKDRRFCRQLALNAHRDLVASGAYSYRAFVSSFDRELERAVPSPVRTRTVSRTSFYARNYVRHGQAIIPYRKGFVVGPSTGYALELMRRGFSRLPRTRMGPALSRLIRNPKNFMVKAVATTGAVLLAPNLRALLWQYARARGVRTRAHPFYLFDDLRKLDIVRRVRSGALVTRQPFEVLVDFDCSAGVLALISRPTAPGRQAGGDLPDELEAALVEGKVVLFLWDHSALGHQIVYAVGRRRWLTLGLGPGGVHRFDAIADVYRQAPRVIGFALLSLLRGEPGSR